MPPCGTQTPQDAQLRTLYARWKLQFKQSYPTEAEVRACRQAARLWARRWSTALVPPKKKPARGNLQPGTPNPHRMPALQDVKRYGIFAENVLRIVANNAPGSRSKNWEESRVLGRCMPELQRMRTGPRWQAEA